MVLGSVQLSNKYLRTAYCLQAVGSALGVWQEQNRTDPAFVLQTVQWPIPKTTRNDISEQVYIMCFSLTLIFK